MSDIRDLRIVKIDETRPPRILKQPYINLFFELSQQAPSAWCQDFNDLAKSGKFPANVDKDKGQHIETWVRETVQIEPLLAALKIVVKNSTERYLERIRLEAAASADTSQTDDDDGDQGRLNKVIAGLNFED